MCETLMTETKKQDFVSGVNVQLHRNRVKKATERVEEL
jgi:hypothetical protein